MESLHAKAGGGSFLAAVLRTRETKNVFTFVCALGAYACVQGLYGIYIDSLGLIADAFHNAFHCVGLGVSLVGMLYAEQPPTFAFSYGYDRHEVLAAFANALFLIFLCAYVIVGALHRLVEPSHLVPDTARILEFGLASLAINVAGVLTVTGVPGGAGAGGSLDYAHKFSASVAAGGGGASAGSQLLAWAGLGGGGGDLPLPATGSAGRGAHASNVRAVHITLLSHVVSSSAVVVSSLLVRFFGIVWADTLQSVVVSLITLTLAVPLFTSTGLILLQAAPEGLRPALERARREASVVEGVIEVCDERFWTQSPGCVVGSLTVRTRHGADSQAVLKRVRGLYARAVQDLTVQVEAEPDVEAALWASRSGGGGSGAGAQHHGGDHHGHSHAHGGHGHSHGSGGGDDHHGHSHGGHDESGDHGHAHDGPSSKHDYDAHFLQRFAPPVAPAAGAAFAPAVAPAAVAPSALSAAAPEFKPPIPGVGATGAAAFPAAPAYVPSQRRPVLPPGTVPPLPSAVPLGGTAGGAGTGNLSARSTGSVGGRSTGSAHGHSHAAGGHGHSHGAGGDADEHHGHSHGVAAVAAAEEPHTHDSDAHGDHGQSHAAGHGEEGGHGHSHEGGHGHAHDDSSDHHGHSHAAGEGDHHGHSHGGNGGDHHGHSHGAHDDSHTHI